MSFWDGIKKFAQPYGEDDYDDYEDELNDYTEETVEAEAEPAAPRRRRSPFATAEPLAEQPAAAPAAPAATGFGGQVLNMATAKCEVVLFHAKTFDDAARAANDLRAKKAVIINMENVDKALTRRVVDFLSGAVYALGGNVRKVAQATYLFGPNDMNIVGDLENIKSEDNYI